MFAYLIRRLMTMIPMFFLMTGVYFAVQNYLPGGPVQEVLARIQFGGGDGGGRSMSVDDIAKLKAELEKQYGLDKPVPVRYWNWLKKIAVLDFGDSTATREPAIHTIADRTSDIETGAILQRLDHSEQNTNDVSQKESGNAEPH